MEQLKQLLMLLSTVPQSVCLSYILKLKVGDRIAVSRDAGTLYDTNGEHFTVFSGFMLSQ